MLKGFDMDFLGIKARIYMKPSMCLVRKISREVLAMPRC